MRKLKGIILSDSISRTVTVRVDRLRMHQKYQKYERVSKKFKAHDEKGECQKGDEVMIAETRPISREKHWKVVELLKRPESKEAND